MTIFGNNKIAFWVLKQKFGDHCFTPTSPQNGGVGICFFGFITFGGVLANFEKWEILPCILLKEAKKSQTPFRKGPRRFQNVLWPRWSKPNQNPTDNQTFETFRTFCHTLMDINCQHLGIICQLSPQELVHMGTCPGGSCLGGSCQGGSCLLAIHSLQCIWPINDFKSVCLSLRMRPWMGKDVDCRCWK